MSRIPVLRLAGLLLLPALAGACGVGAVQESTFVYGSMGPEGGTVAIEEVRLEIPPGALAGPTTIAILPEAGPLPIQAPLQDPCEYAVLGPQYCCGPVGLELLEDGRLAVSYDETLLPEDVPEDDVVLLLWDEGLGALVPAGDAAMHDPDADRFEVDAYEVLGHLAVGFRTCPEAGIVFLGLNLGPLPLRVPKQGDASVTVDEPSGLWLVNADGSVEAAQLPTDDLVPQGFLPSPDGRTVLYEFIDFQTEVFEPELYGVGVPDGIPVLLAGDDEEVDSSGPTMGWMRDGSRVFFQERLLPGGGGGLVADIADVASFSTVPGDGSAGPTSLHDVGPFSYIEDVRQSLDGNLVMIAYYDSSEDLLVDVINSASGVPASEGVIPFGGGHNSPRFLPDSSGLYLVDSDRAAVDRYDPDGSNPSTLFALPPEHGSLKDFVLAPNGDDYAYVARQFPVDQKPNQVAVPGFDALYVGSLTGGLREVVDLGVSTSYAEFIFHPDGRHVFLDSFPTDVLMFAASNGAPGPELGVDGIGELDISADDGRLLLVVRSGQVITASTGGGSTRGEGGPGLYVADPDGRNQTLVPTPADLIVNEARWLRTVRRAVCMRGSDCFR